MLSKCLVLKPYLFFNISLFVNIFNQLFVYEFHGLNIILCEFQKKIDPPISLFIWIIRMYFGSGIMRPSFGPGVKKRLFLIHLSMNSQLALQSDFCGTISKRIQALKLCCCNNCPRCSVILLSCNDESSLLKLL